jgi:protein-disulfide isomerase
MCALKAGLDVVKIGSCASGQEGKDLLTSDVKIGQELNIGASPTWFANNYKTFSALSAQDIKTNICSLNPGLVGCGTQLSSNTTVAAGACATP